MHKFSNILIAVTVWTSLVFLRLLAQITLNFICCTSRSYHTELNKSAETVRATTTPTPHKPQLSLSCSSGFLSQHHLEVNTLAFAFYLTVVRSLLCVSRTDILESCWCTVIALRVATAVLEKESCCVHTTSLHCALQTLRGFAVAENAHSSQVMSPSSTSHTDSSGRKCLKQINAQFTSRTSYSTF